MDFLTGTFVDTTVSSQGGCKLLQKLAMASVLKEGFLKYYCCHIEIDFVLLIIEIGVIS